MARRADRHRCDSAVAARCRAAALRERGVDEHDGARRLRHSDRRGCRRRHHRYRKHHATLTPGARRRQRSLGRPGHPGSVARGARTDRFRDPDRRDRCGAGAVHGGPVRRLLQTARSGLPVGDSRVDDRGGDGDPGDGPALASQCPTGQQGFTARGLAFTRLYRTADEGHARSAPGLRGGGRGHADGRRNVAAARPFIAARFQGTRLPDALGDQARHLAS